MLLLLGFVKIGFGLGEMDRGGYLIFLVVERVFCVFFVIYVDGCWFILGFCLILFY